MTNEPLQEIDERIFTLHDIVLLFKRKKVKIFRIALFAWVLGFGLFLLKVPKYKFEATFKEGVEKSSGDGALKDLLLNVGASSMQPEAAAIMKSYQILKPLTAKLGLQASVAQGGKLSKLYRRIEDNLKAERGKPLEDLDRFVFRDVVYEEEEGIFFFLRFEDATHFSILGQDKKPIVQGILGREVCLPKAQFTLIKAPKNLRFRRLYRLQIAPWLGIANGLRAQLKISNNKMNKSIYDLCYFSRDRIEGALLLNELCFEYQRYLKRNHDQVSKEQLLYLDQRQEEVFQKMAFALKEHAEAVSQNIEEKGFTGLEEEVDEILAPHRQMAERVLAIEVELAKLQQFEKDDHWLAATEESPFFGNLQGISNEVRNLKQQRDLLELSLQKEQKLPFLEDRQLCEVRSQQEGSKKLLEALMQGASLADFDLSLLSWAEHLRSAKEEKSQDFIHYLEWQIRLLSLREKMLQERLFYGDGESSEFEGIDLSTANQLFVQYNGKLDEYEAEVRQFAQLKGEILHEDFEISSLSSVLEDPLSRNLIADAGKLAFRLKDEGHQSEKEGQRWREELLLQKKVLKDHLEQLFKVAELNVSLIRQKMTDLQKMRLDCINRQISVCYEKARDFMKERREALLVEKDLLEKRMAEFRSSITDLPEKWRLQKWLSLKTEMGVKIMEALTQLIESKTIGHHLHHVESRPLDLAIIPTVPQSPRLFQMSFLFSFAAAFGFFFLTLLSTILKGFPSSLEKLRAMRFPLLGEISSFCDGPEADAIGGDLETLRQLSLFLEKPPEAKVVALFAGKGPDYSYALAEMLARRSLRPLLIRCDFGAKYKNEDLPGLLQFWKKEIEEIPIRSKEGFDLLTAGGFTPYGTEILQSKMFEELLHLLKGKYDALFLFFRSPLESAESTAALRLSDKAVVTVSGEATERLTPFADWAYHQGNCRLQFMTLRCP